MGRVARGVPECFVTGKVVRKEKEKKEGKEVKKEDGVTAAGVSTPVASIATPAPAAPMVAPTPAPAANTNAS